MPKKFSLLCRPLLAGIVGALTSLAFAPFQLWPIAIISPILLLLLLHNRSAKMASLIGFMWSLGLLGAGISWVHVSMDVYGGLSLPISLLLMLILVSYLSIYSALFAGLLNRFFPRSTPYRFMLVAPALWLIADWLRSWMLTGFPWLWLGYSQIDSPLSSFAPIGGVQLITLVIVLGAGACAYALLNKKPYWLALPVALFIGGYGLKFVDWVTLDATTKTSFTLVQGNIEQSKKWLPSERWPTLTKYLDMTRPYWNSDVIVWTEAAIPALEVELQSFLRNLDRTAKSHDNALITGIISRDEEKKEYYNSIIALGNTLNEGQYNYKTQHRYHKYNLLPFGEFVPFGDLLRPIAPFFNLPMSSFQRGDYVQPNVVANNRHFVPALCYEIIFGERLRRNSTKDTDFILTISNDTWFGESHGPFQHMEIARMRALELGKPLIRSTNDGITAITDYRGKIIDQIPQFQDGVLNAEVTSTKGNTPYHIMGRWPLAIFIVLALALSFVRASRLPD